MKHLTFILLTSAILLSGCGKKEETPAAVTEAAPEAPVAEEAVTAAEAPVAEDTVTALTETVTTQVEEVVESVVESLPDVEDVVESLPEVEGVSQMMPDLGESVPSLPSTDDVTVPAMPEMGTTAPAQPQAEAEVAVVEEKSTTSALMDQAKTAAMTAAASVDWANLSWADVASIPYNDKEKLLAWAGPQITSMKDKLTKAAMDKGTTSLMSLGDTGWQGAIKSAMSGLESVRTSSPETWEMARGALVNGWEVLQAEAGKYIGEG
jgi:hypothetical protein